MQSREHDMPHGQGPDIPCTWQRGWFTTWTEHDIPHEQSILQCSTWTDYGVPKQKTAQDTDTPDRRLMLYHMNRTSRYNHCNELLHMESAWYSTQSAHGTVYHTNSAWYCISQRQYMVYIGIHCIPHLAWYRVPHLHVSALYTALSVHGILHGKSMVYRTVSARYFTNLWRIAQTIDRH
jgi:hypothetical protein